MNAPTSRDDRQRLWPVSDRATPPAEGLREEDGRPAVGGSGGVGRPAPNVARSAWPGRCARLPADQSGSISIVSVFAVLLLAFLLGMVMNSSLQVDQKVKMQNAADAATYSGAVVVGRSLNTLAYTNHLLCDVFALTAFMREARDRKAESLTPEILRNWARIGPAFAESEFSKFAELGVAIQDKVPHEREVVRTFSDWAAAASALMLPVFEQILSEERIPEFQRALVRTTTPLAQAAADEVARRHGRAWPRPTNLSGCLWRTNGETVAASDVTKVGSVVDPVTDDVPPGRQFYLEHARAQRFELAHRYLRNWNDESLPLFDGYVKMSQFGNLWRIFTGGHLQKLLDSEYPNRNLPFQVLAPPGEIAGIEGRLGYYAPDEAARLNTYLGGCSPREIAGLNEYLEDYYMVVGVVYREKMSDRIPGVFRNPVAPDTQAYAQAMVFVPKRRLIKVWPGGPGGGGGDRASTQTGIPGQGVGVGGPPSAPVAPPPPSPPPPGEEPSEAEKIQPTVVRQDVWYHPDAWSLICQNWTAQLVPATCGRIPQILSTPPASMSSSAFDLPALSDLSDEEFLWISNH